MNARQAHERKMERHFEETQKLASLERAVKQEKFVKGAAACEERIAYKRRQRMLAEQEQERIQQRSLEAADLSRRQAAFAQTEHKIAEELERRRLAGQQEERMLQKVRDESHELRELEQRLRAAYMNKERRNQVVEKEAADERERDAAGRLELQMEAKRIRAMRADKEREEKRKHDLAASKEVLALQMQEAERAKQLAYEEFLKEKKQVDDVVAKVLEEEHQARLAQMEMQAESRAYIKQYLIDRERWKEEERRRQAEEDAAIAAYAEAVKQRELGDVAAREAREAAKQQIFDEISAAITATRREEEEFLDLQITLANQEAEEKRVQADKLAAEKRIKSRLAMMEANEYQKKLKAAQRAQEMEEEETFRQRMLAKFAEDERLEQMNAQKRRMKAQEHKREVERLLDERRAMYEEEREKELADQAYAAKLIEERAAIIEQERQRILGEHAKRLGIDDLPRGVLTSKQDLELWKQSSAADGGAGAW